MCVYIYVCAADVFSPSPPARRRRVPCTPFACFGSVRKVGTRQFSTAPSESEGGLGAVEPKSVVFVLSRLCRPTRKPDFKQAEDDGAEDIHLASSWRRPVPVSCSTLLFAICKHKLNFSGYDDSAAPHLFHFLCGKRSGKYYNCDINIFIYNSKLKKKED